MSMPDLQSRDNLVPDVVDMRFSDDPSPPAQTILSPVVRLRAECYRAELILTGAVEDDGAGIHDDPLTRYLTCHDRLRRLLPPTAASPVSDGTPVPGVGLRGTPPAAQRTSVRTHSPTPQATSRSPATMHSHTLPPVTFASALPSPAQRRTRLVRPQPTSAPPITP